MTSDYLGKKKTEEKLFPRATAMDAFPCVFVPSAERSFVKLYGVTTFFFSLFFYYYRQTPTQGTFKGLRGKRNSSRTVSQLFFFLPSLSFFLLSLDSPTGYTRRPGRGKLTREIEPRPRSLRENRLFLFFFSSSKILILS